MRPDSIHRSRFVIPNSTRQTSKRPLRRASTSGEKLLRRLLPPGYFRWLELLGDGLGSRAELFAVAGSLASIAAGLEKAYLNAGSDVRDLVLALHLYIKYPERPATESVAGLKAYDPWFRARLAPHETDSSNVRSVYFQWIDAASERLTLKAYQGPGHRARHARVLIARPLSLIDSEGRAPIAEAMLPLAEFVLRFWDLLDADRQTAMGRNRISDPEHGRLGASYAMAGDVELPTGESYNAALRRLVADSSAFPIAEMPLSLRPAAERITAELRGAVEHRLNGGEWPADFRLAGPDERQTPRGRWRKLFG